MPIGRPLPRPPGSVRGVLPRTLLLPALLVLAQALGPGPRDARAADAAPEGAPRPTHQIRCTVILQTRPDRLYCYATNQPFRVLLSAPARFAHGEELVASGNELVGQWIESIPTLLGASVERLGVTNLPPALALTPGQVLGRKLNYHRVALRGRVVSHEWMKFLDHHIEVVVLEGVDRPFRVNALNYSDTRNRWPVGTEVEVVGLSFIETFAPARGPEVQIDLEDLSECRILAHAPWLTLEVARRMVTVGVGFLVMGGLWLWRERRQVANLRAADLEVRRLNGDLERRIEDRTRELREMNGRLREEVAAREQAEASLRDALTAERELGEMKSRFVSLVSHEFRTPLAVIMSSAEIVHAYLDRLPPAQRRRHLEDIVAAAGQMGRMVDDVLFLSRHEAGRLRLSAVEVDLLELGRELTTDLQAATQERCRIRFEPAGPLPPASADPEVLRHLFTNLLTNAVKYSPEEAIVAWSVRAEGREAVFEVHDHGIGIPESDQRQLFTAFHRGSNVGSTKGTGLGLVIVKACTELHGGSVTVESAVGRGTIFRVRLPVLPIPGPVEPEAVASHPVAR